MIIKGYVRERKQRSQKCVQRGDSPCPVRLWHMTQSKAADSSITHRRELIAKLGEMLPGLDLVLIAHEDDDPWVILNILLAPDSALGGRSLFQAIQEGDARAIARHVAEAKGYGPETKPKTARVKFGILAGIVPPPPTAFFEDLDPADFAQPSPDRSIPDPNSKIAAKAKSSVRPRAKKSTEQN
ncbi:hypothetical protein [Paracoccus ravus]|uniref:hypothetical protein n=1 Tax=Paracoccus ravus TaxID=2447760 RepID=UPI00106E67B6|nr:hypothetical protein [Paracoccus ravus]